MSRREEIQRQLMATFQAELKEHLGMLNKGLLALEQGVPAQEQEALLADMFRAAHSLKGAAAAVNLGDIQTIAHRLEDVLAAIRRKEVLPSPQVVDRLFPALDAISEAMAAHKRGEGLPAEEKDRLLARLGEVLRGELEGDQEEKGPEDFPVPRTPLPHAPALSPEQTIRVSTDKLDALMAGVGELLVARMRTAQRLKELRALQQRLGRWTRGWRQVQVRYHRLQRRSLATAVAGSWTQDKNREDLGQDMAPLLEFLSENEKHLKSLERDIRALHRGFTADYNHLSLLTDDLHEGVRRVRMLPVGSLLEALPRMVRDLAREHGKEVVLHVEGTHTEVDRQVLELMRDPLIHLLRNAVDHGIESPQVREAAGKPRRGTIRLAAAQKGNTLVLEVGDDGAGIDVDAVRKAAIQRGLISPKEAAGLGHPETLNLIFRSQLSTRSETTSLSGRGVGLDVVRKGLEQLQGLVEVNTAPGKGTTFLLTLPLTLATSQVLLVEAGGLSVALPTTTVERILRIDPAQIGHIEGKPAISVNGRPLPLASLAHVLELPAAAPPETPGQKIPVVVVGVAEQRVPFRVDELHAPQEVLVKPLGRQLRRVPNVAGATILGTGQVVVILNAADLVNSAQSAPAMSPESLGMVSQPRRRRVLVVDDSLTTRALEKSILENAGYEVLLAGDGEEAWALVQSEPLDAIVADINMPRMDGFALTEKVKQSERFKEMPLVLVTSLESPHDKMRGMEAGADAYITKGTFDQQKLLETLERLIGQDDSRPYR